MLDLIDKQILAVLQTNAKISNTELAEQINLSPTPCLRRVKILEEKGIIKRYVTELDKTKLGLTITAFVFIELERNNRSTAEAFEKEIELLEEVIEFFVLTGKHDYLLSVVTKDLPSYDIFIKDKLATIPQIVNLDSTFVLNQCSKKRHLPLMLG